jgi:hypothetical protein
VFVCHEISTLAEVAHQGKKKLPVSELTGSKETLEG